MRNRAADLRVLERLMPSENGVTVFDAETQETSYGIHFVDGLPYIFDTHRKEGRYVATIELLTEVVTPVRISSDRIRRFCHEARDRGLFPIPYTGCFFKGNLHVYAFSGPIRGLDLATLGATVAESERRLFERVASLWPRVPDGISRPQRDLLGGRRRPRYAADLDVLVRRVRARPKREADRADERRTL